MIRRVLERSVPFVLVLLIVVDVTMLAGVVVERRDLRLVNAHYEREGGIGSGLQLAGFGRGGTPLDLGGGTGGFAVRYASSGCPFSRIDEQWNVLAPKLQERGLQVVVLLPNAQDEFSKDALVPKEAQQEAYVSIEWIKRYRLTLTPTLLIFDAHRRLIWHREGSLRPADTRAAIRAIDTARQSR